MITPIWIVGFTGHRPKDAPGRTSAELKHLATKIREELALFKAKAEAQGGRADFLCGVAAGADLIAAQQARELKMAVHVILPMPEAHYAEDFASQALEDDWALAKRFIQQAKEGLDGATFRILNGCQWRDECYYDLGMQIVYASDAIIALWDGLPPPPVADSGVDSSGRGGTADVIALAEADSMPYLREEATAHGYVWRPTPMRLIHSVTGEVTGQMDDFASPDDAGLVEIRALQHAADMEHGQHQPLNSVQSLMEFIDRGALDWASRLRRWLLLGSMLHFSASLIAAISAGIQGSDTGRWTPAALTSIELALVLVAIGLLVLSYWRHAQARWLELRLATELTRGLVASGRTVDPLFPVATDQLPGWRRFCLSVGLTVWGDRSTLRPCADLPDAEQACLEADKSSYLVARIEDQLNHFQQYDPHSRHWWHRYAHFAGPITSGLAVFFIMNALLHKIHEAEQPDLPCTPRSPLWSLVYYFLPIALPLIAGAIASLQTVTDAKRRAHVYPEMAERLRSAKELLSAVKTPNALRRFVRHTEEILLNELVGWYAAAKGISH